MLVCCISIKTHNTHLPFTSRWDLLLKYGHKVQASKWQPINTALWLLIFPAYAKTRLTNTKTWVAFLAQTHGWNMTTSGDLECLLSLGELNNTQELSVTLCKHTLNSWEENVCSFLELLFGALYMLKQAKEFGSRTVMDKRRRSALCANQGILMQYHFETGGKRRVWTKKEDAVLFERKPEALFF